MRIQVDTVSSVDKHDWDTFVCTHPLATHYHLSGWGEIIERVYRYPGLYFSAWDEDRIIGVVPMVLLGGRSAGKVSCRCLTWTTVGSVLILLPLDTICIGLSRVKWRRGRLV